MTVIKSEPEETPRKLTLDEKIRRVEDLTLLIERSLTLIELRRKLQIFQIGADSLSSTINLRDGSGNEFQTSNSVVISAVIDEMKRILHLKVRDIEDQFLNERGPKLIAVNLRNPDLSNDI